MIQSLDVISIQWQTKMYSMLSISIIMMLYCYQETSPTQSCAYWAYWKDNGSEDFFQDPG